MATGKTGARGRGQAEGHQRVSGMQLGQVPGV